MATTASPFLSPAKLSLERRLPRATWTARRSVRFPPVRAQDQQQQVKEEEEEAAVENLPPPPQEEEQRRERKTRRQGPAQPLPVQPLAESKNMSREYGGQWLSCTTRHIRIYAAYINPETNAFDQTQMDKLTLLLDPTDEFVWTDETCQKVYDEFQDLVDHYEGAELSEYTLRLIGSDLEHFIRKLLYDGEIKYNMMSRVLNFSMGKPRIKFNSSQIPDVK
ncbi:nAD(P)H-quinone oxidoreductase subunit M, chloroplastic [Oryza sativa Japonica Group]|uniref:NAD(P)H-quinone oxidoreductase subunit M, chloroplastic n=4 Tax=Oryza TaxID=4527 RepID=NDHM_ORYSJ|nr:nAD(P)H-quinone oxidoreductase subunit M, chloroplastic [Oryza sativa Japonica Group]A2XVZ1.1 RecName: Full=NAD(P)H-quinone oxidoreductase subunit M, chloroplastic; AltName: Full=NAD(P)H dehydrogenase subunit M; Short=NDH subunit M; Short=NDH-M; AltName: Full=NADH-plastoquinone oxidoreductase subunit M; Flags: Precursor [Oryza sativa Indica Group]Q7FB12.1 RecName: Full=NAD(P)H-quinone oxidoreductase subunit M, chloroplastic; AltName: Full=NAD(P)H dehydrogenase subunit M; Short=NDH subunit M; S|eukprot:NP_001053435.1 Os04g0539000 [Oryza sativa Japonica Group]